MRLPLPLDEWLASRLALHPERSASEVLVALVHGGLRLREGYMAIHKRTLEAALRNGDGTGYAIYRRALDDTFGADYVAHVERWLEADGFSPPPRKPASAGRNGSP